MKPDHHRLPCYWLTLLVPAMAIILLQATAWPEEPPAAQSSGNHQSVSENPEGLSEMFKGTVTEVIRASRHIYVQVDTGEERIWGAVPSFDGKPGDRVLVPPGVPAANFQSRELKRKFKIVIFVGGLRPADGSKKQ